MVALIEFVHVRPSNVLNKAVCASVVSLASGTKLVIKKKWIPQKE